MRAFRALFLTFLLLGASSQAAVITLSGTSVTNPDDASGVDLGDGFATAVIVDTGKDGFLLSTSGQIVNSGGSPLTLGSFLSGNELVVGLNASTSFLGTEQIPGNASFENTDPFSSGIDISDGTYAFGVVWFTTQTHGNSTLITGDQYGFATAANWLIQSTGSLSFGTNFTQFDDIDAVAGTVTAAAVPEPSTTLVLAALGMGGLLLARFRRKKRSAAPLTSA